MVGNFALLRMRRGQPSHRSAADRSDEIPPSHVALPEESRPRQIPIKTQLSHHGRGKVGAGSGDGSFDHIFSIPQVRLGAKPSALNVD